MFEFKNMLHDTWLETYGPYVRRAPPSQELENQLNGELNEYFKNTKGEWIPKVKEYAVKWATQGSCIIPELLEYKDTFNDTTTSDEKAHFQEIIDIALDLESYE